MCGEEAGGDARRDSDAVEGAGGWRGFDASPIVVFAIVVFVSVVAAATSVVASSAVPASLLRLRNEASRLRTHGAVSRGRGCSPCNNTLTRLVSLHCLLREETEVACGGGGEETFRDEEGLELGDVVSPYSE